MALPDPGTTTDPIAPTTSDEATRDMFAANALMGILQAPPGFPNPAPDQASKLAYEYADAMLVARAAK